MTANLLDFDLEGLARYCEELGERRFRATQLFRWIHQRGASEFAQMTDLARSLREKLATRAGVVPMPVLSRHESADGTIKWLFDAGDGNADRYSFQDAVHIVMASPASACWIKRSLTFGAGIEARA